MFKLIPKEMLSQRRNVTYKFIILKIHIIINLKLPLIQAVS